jgi:transposase
MATEEVVMHFWVAKWMLFKQKPWSKKELAAEFQVSYPTASTWTQAAERAGIISVDHKRKNAKMYRSCLWQP